jgi:hypothetical protein
MSLVEPVDFVLHILAKSVDLVLREPLSMQVAPTLVLDQVFLFLGILSEPSP